MRLVQTAHPATRVRRVHMAMTLVIIVAAAAMLSQSAWHFSAAHDPETPERIAAQLASREHQALIAATREGVAAPALVGEDAVRINAALPFSKAPILPASSFSMLRAAASDKERAQLCMAQAIYYEAGFEPLEGRRAVAQVVLNRLRHPAFPKTVCGVVYEGADRRVCQFSFTCDGSLARTPAAGAWREAQAIAKAALAGAVERAVGTATHYHTDWVSPYWAPRLTKLVQVGAHIFYRWPGSWGMPAAFSGRYAGLEALPALELPAAQPDVPAEVAAILAKMPPERRAENDVGGRLDVTKGWSLSIPAPDETRSAFATATSGQAAPAPRTAALASADPAADKQRLASQ